MFLNEPPRSQYDLNFSLAGVPVRVHPWFWLVVLLLGRPLDATPQELLIWLIAVFVSILVHELGHVLAFGYYHVRARVVLHSFGGLAIPEGPAPRGYGANIVIALAGPAAGFVLAGVLMAGLIASGAEVSLDPRRSLPSWIRVEFFEPLNLYLFCWQMLYINVFWGLVNLLPVYPLDGGQVARNLLSRFNPGDGVRQSLLLSLLTAGGMAVLAAARWNSVYVAILFGLLAWSSYTTLQAYSGGRPW